MMKKLSILVLLSQAAGMCAMEGDGFEGAPFGSPQAAGNATAGSGATASLDGGEEESNLSDAQALEYKELCRLVATYADLDYDTSEDIDRRLALLPVKNREVIRLKALVVQEKEIEEKEALEAERVAREAAELERPRRAEAKRLVEQARKEQEAKETAQREEAARKETVQVQQLTALERKIISLEEEHDRCAADPRYKSPVRETEYQVISDGISSLLRDGVTQQIKNDAKTLKDRYVAFTKMPYGLHILGFRSQRPLVRQAQGNLGTTSLPNKGGQGGNLSTNKGGKTDTGKTPSSGDDKKKGGAWIRPAVGITLVALAGYGLWNWYSNSTKPKAN